MKTFLTIVVCACVSACHLPNPSPTLARDKAARSPGDPEPPMQPQAVQRDETLVAADAPGTVRIVEGPLREVSGVTSGRAWLLETYQNTLSEKLELARRLAANEVETGDLRKAHAALVAEHATVAARSTELDARVRELETQTIDLARRLAESEIARLELQKSDLEREARHDRMERGARNDMTERGARNDSTERPR